jgi:membrane-associated phospholipid phosphatase
MEICATHNAAVEQQELETPECLLPWNWRNCITPFAFIIVSILIIPWSTELFHFIYHLLRALPVSSLFDTAVQLTSWPILLIIFVTIYRVDKKRSKYLCYFVCALLATTLVNAPVKQLAGRSRPEWSVEMSKDKRLQLARFNEMNDASQVPLTRTDHWFGPRLDRPYFMDRYASFPSGHAAAAFAIAAFLCALYPEARALWLAAAIACALSRVYGERHFLEDVSVGGAIGWLMAMWAFSWHWPLALQCRLVQRITEYCR